MNDSTPSGTPVDDLPHATEGGTVFTRHFSAEEQRQLMSEDRSAQLGISAILGMLIGIGMLLGIMSVIIIRAVGL